MSLTLLGAPAVVLPDAAAEDALCSAKGLALLAYLALEPGPHRREELAALLWGDSPEGAARASLRQALRRLRSAIGDTLSIRGQIVELTGPVECDVTAFLNLAERDPRAAAACGVPQFLEGFSLRHAAAFEDWAGSVRRRLQRRYEDVLESLALSAFRGSRWREAAAWADHWLLVDPLSEEATRIAVEARSLGGDRGAALACLTEHRRRLAEETGAAPSAALQALAARIAAAPGEAATFNDPPPPSEPAFDAELVGREAAWLRLQEVWSAVARARGGVVLVEGEAGVGKTRLAEEFLRWAALQGATVVRGHCSDGQRSVAYGPLFDVLRELLAAPGAGGTAPEWLNELARLLPGVRERFAGVATPAAGGTAERWRLLEAIVQLLLAVAAERPTICLFDDVQWADAETGAALGFLSRRLADAPVLLLGTVTLGEIDRASAAARLLRDLRARADTTVITLTPLSEDELWRLLRLLGRIGAPQGGRRLAHRLHAVTDGNPYHAIEVLKELFARGLLTADPTSGEWLVSAGTGVGYGKVELPRTVHDAVARRVARLPYELRDVVATMAVAGRGVRTDLLSHVHGMSRLRAAALADALVDRHLAAEADGVYRCAHPVIAAAVRRGLTLARRGELHRSIALALDILQREGESIGSEEVAHHAALGRERALAWRHALGASAAAVERYAFEEALTWLDVAAEMEPGPEERTELERQTALVLTQAGWRERPAQRWRRRSSGGRLEIERRDLDLGQPELSR